MADSQKDFRLPEGVSLGKIETPKPVGYWKVGPLQLALGDFRYYTYRKPRWLTRLAVKLIFETEWIPVIQPVDV